MRVFTTGVQQLHTMLSTRRWCQASQAKGSVRQNFPDARHKSRWSPALLTTGCRSEVPTTPLPHALRLTCWSDSQKSVHTRPLLYERMLLSPLPELHSFIIHGRGQRGDNALQKNVTQEVNWKRCSGLDEEKGWSFPSPSKLTSLLLLGVHQPRSSQDPILLGSSVQFSCSVTSNSL